MWLVILEVVIAVFLSIAYYKLCHNRKQNMAGKIIEITSLYGLNILAFTGKIKLWVLLVGVAVIGCIKILTTKNKNIETGHNGMAD